jgi:PEP-CTERM/exosortase A-associated glycosyltransferase
MCFRVLHVFDHSWPILDGYSQRSRSIVTAQKELGMHPSVLTGPLHQTDDPGASEILLDGIRYLRTHVNGGISGRAIHGRWPVVREMAVVHSLEHRVKPLLDSGAFDIVHAHSPSLCGLAAWRASRACHLPFVYEIRSFWEDSDLDENKSLPKRLRYTAGRSLETFVVRRADAIVGIARPMLQELEARGVASTRLFHVPNGVDVARFSPRSRDGGLAARLGTDGIPTLGFIGTLFPWEGVAWLVRAAAELHRGGTRFKLLIVGDGAEGSEVSQAIQATGSADYVSFLGRVPNDQIERYYSLMDVLVYPRRSVRITEMVTPLKPLEAMALGKAVLGSGVGGIRELIEPGETGMVFQPGNIEDFCRQAALLLQQPALRSALGEHARERIVGEKDWKVLARRYEGVYEAAVGNARKHS